MGRGANLKRKASREQKRLQDEEDLITTKAKAWVLANFPLAYVICAVVLCDFKDASDSVSAGKFKGYGTTQVPIEEIIEKDNHHKIGLILHEPSIVLSYKQEEGEVMFKFELLFIPNEESLLQARVWNGKVLSKIRKFQSLINAVGYRLHKGPNMSCNFNMPNSLT